MTPNAFLVVGVVVDAMVGRMGHFLCSFHSIVASTVEDKKEGVVEGNPEMFLLDYIICVLIHLHETSHCSWIPVTSLC